MKDRSTSGVKPSREVRDGFGDLLKTFRSEGEGAEPVIFGAQRCPEAVMLSYERYEAIQRGMDDVVIAAEVIDRDRKDTGKRLSFDELARELGFDLTEFEE